MKRKLSEKHTAALFKASEDINALVASAVYGLEDEQLRDRIIMEFNAGSAVIRQITELRPGLLTSEFNVELADGKIVELGGVGF